MNKYLIVFLCLFSPALGFSQNSSNDLDYRYITMKDGTRIFVGEVGQGEPIIVLHGGWGATHNYLTRPLKPFFDQYHFTFYNQRGSQKSAAPDGTISLQRFVSDLENIRQDIGANKVTLLSHGIGSNLAYAYLKRHPDHIKGFILVAPNLPTGLEKDENNLKVLKAAQKRLRYMASKEKKELKEEGLYRKDNYNASEDSAYRRIGFAAFLIYHIERWRQIEDGATFSLTHEIPKLMEENTSKELKDSLWATLQSYPKPIHVIIGDYPSFSSEWRKVDTELNYLKLHKIKNAGRHLWIDQPEEFNKYVEKALRGTTK